MYLENKVLDFIKSAEKDLALSLLNDIGIVSFTTKEIGGKIICAAADKGYFEILKAAVEKDGDVNYKANVLATAAFNRDYRMFRYLLKNGADLSIQGAAAMRSACGNGELEMIKLLHEKGFDVAKRAEKGQMVDHFVAWAAKWGHTGVVEYLVENGASVVEMDNAAIVAAGGHGRRACMHFLQKNGADINARSGEIMALCATYNNPINMQYCFDAGFDLTKNVEHILSQGVSWGCANAVVWLQVNGVDLNLTPVAAIKALERYAGLDDPTFKLLRDAGVDVDVVLENKIDNVRMHR